MMWISRIGLASILVVSGLAAACGGDDDAPSVVQQCNDAAAAVCAQMFKCIDAATIETLFGYTSESGCVSAIKADEGCDSKTADNFCEGSLKFHSDQANKCLTQVKDASCAQISSGDQSSYAPACDLVCTVD